MNGKKSIVNILVKIFLTLFLLCWLGFFLCQKIDLTTVDLGRHLKNGEWIFQNSQVLFTNFYSYTAPNFAAPNHHWLGGLTFFLVEKLSGFNGLSLFYIILSLAAFFLLFFLAQKENFPISFLTALLLIPLIGERREIRPEIFSYFLGALFFYILWQDRKEKINKKWLWLLPFLEIIWANLHIYFFLGPLLIGVFLLDGLIDFFKTKNELAKRLAVIFLLTVVATIITPFGFKSILYPLTIFQNYGYRIIENQSIGFLEKLGFIQNPNFWLFRIAFSWLIISFVLVALFNRRIFSFGFLILASLISVAAWLAIRNFTLFAFFALPLISYNFGAVFRQKTILRSLTANLGFILMTTLILILSVLNYLPRLPIFNGNFGLGLTSGTAAAADFFQKENIQGPIFNNYDIGSYLIYELFPEHRVFVDNRPEAYPTSFLEQVYIPMQENEAVWSKKAKEYNFNAIFFAYRDMTPWAQKFLINRLRDPLWAPIFADQYAIIFLKRNESNREIIKKYEIPKDFFQVIKQN